MKLSFWLFLAFLLIGSVASAVTVKKIVLQPRETGVFPASVRVALNTKTGQTLVDLRTFDFQHYQARKADLDEYGRFLSDLPYSCDSTLIAQAISQS
jgi:hypothetical protein